MARLKWAEFNHCPTKKIIKNGNISYNFYLSQYEAFYKKYSMCQEFNWVYHCPNEKCPIHEQRFDKSSKFSFKYNIFIFFVKIQTCQKSHFNLKKKHEKIFIMFFFFNGI